MLSATARPTAGSVGPVTRASAAARVRGSGLGVTAGLIGWFIVVELVSGILQGYYVPLFSDIVIALEIHDSDVNWFEAGQLLLSALVLPILAKLGDMFGPKQILLISRSEEHPSELQ